MYPTLHPTIGKSHIISTTDPNHTHTAYNPIPAAHYLPYNVISHTRPQIHQYIQTSTSHPKPTSYVIINHPASPVLSNIKGSKVYKATFIIESTNSNTRPTPITAQFRYRNPEWYFPIATTISVLKYPDPSSHFLWTKLKLDPHPRRVPLYYTNPENPRNQGKIEK